MSIPKPPQRGRPDRAAGEPDYDSVDLLPEEELDDEAWEDEGADEAIEDGNGRPAYAGGRGARNGRNGADTNGHAAAADRGALINQGATGVPTAAHAGVVVEEAPPPVRPPAIVPDGEALSIPTPSLREWLGRPWYFGLAYWQVALLGLLAIALVLTRFFDLGVRAMHHDESMHAKFAWDLFHGGKYQYNPLLHGPFQFYAVATSYWLFGATEWTARAVPAAFGIALVCMTLLWRRWLGVAGCLFAIAIFVFSPSFTYFARFLREDSYTATWTMLAATGFVGYVLTARAGGSRARPWFYAFCGGLALAYCTKESTYITIFIFGTFMILSLLWEHANTAQRRVIAGAAAGALVGAFWSMVIGYYKKELHEVGGAIIGLLVGGGIGLAYHFLRPTAPVEEMGTRRGGDTGRKRKGALTPALSQRERESQPAEEGLFTGALRTVWQDAEGFWGVGTFWGGVVLFFVIFFLFYSSFFSNFAGIREGLIGSIQYWLEQHNVQRGNQPWFYYLLLLSVYETLPFFAAMVASFYYLRRPTWLTSFLIWWSVTALVIYSWAGEKMPWLVIHIALPMVLLTGRYLGELATSPLRSVWEKRIVFGAVALLGVWTIHTGWPVNFERSDTPKDLLVYTQTAPDVKKVVADIHRISLEQTGDEYGIGITVQSGTWWPFSWYLRDFKNVDYPSQLTAQATKPIVLIALEDDDKNRPFLQGYTRTKYKMRWWYPEDYRSIPDEMKKSGGLFGYLGRQDVRSSLWKWLIYRDTTQPLGSYDFYVYMKEGLGGPTSTASASTDSSAAQPALPGQQVGQPGQAAPNSQPVVNTQQYAAKTVPLSAISQWGSIGKNAGQFNTPRGVALDSQGNVYVADTLNHRIQKFDRTGKQLLSVGSEGSGDGQFNQPMGVAVDAQGNIYVADTWNHRIQKFDGAGKFLTKWPGQGGFWGPRGIALDTQGNVYVTDTGNKRIQKFDANGKFLAQFGTGGSGPGQLNEPIGIAVSPTGEIWVADTNNRRIQEFDATGKPLAEWPVAGWQQSARTEPYLALDSQGNVYVTDPPNARIIKFSPTGEVLAAGGTPGKAAAQFDLPLGIAVANDAIYVADSNNHRIQAVAPLQ